MADKYVSTTGSDSNPTGTIGAPWQTIAYAVTRTMAGDTLWVRGGTYAGSSASIDAQGHTVNSGSSWSNAVTISGYPGESAILQPSGVGGIRMSDGGASPARSYIIIQDLTMDCVNSTGEGIFLFTAHHIRMQRLDVKNCPGVGGGGFGVHFGDDTPFNEMLNCRIHDIGSIASLVTEGHGLYITASDNLFQGCEVYNCAGYGFHVYNNRGDHGDPNRNIIRNNRIHHNGRITGNTAYGITVAWGDANQVYNNLIYENFAGVQCYTDSTNTLVANNTIYANVNEGVALQFHGAGIIVRNNIIFGNGSTIANIAGTATLDHNVTTDPLVVNAATFDYHLTGASAAVLNLGATISGLAGDYDGGARPFGAAYDVGAYEYGSTAGAVTEPGIDDSGAGGGSGTGGTRSIPASTIVFTGFGDVSSMRFRSPTGADAGQPTSAPDPGSGIDGIVALKPSGRYGVIGGSNFGSAAVGTFNSDLSVHASAGTGGAGKGAARDDNGHFYGGGASFPNGQIIRYDTDAANRTVYGPIPPTGTGTSTGVLGLGVNGAGTIAYYILNSNDPAAPSRTVVYAWDLSGNADLGTFAIEGTGWTVQNNGIIALTNGDVLVGWKKAATNGFVKHYNAAGSVLHTYALTGTHPAPFALTHGFDETTFWVNYGDSALSTFSGVTVAELTLGTGSVVHSWAPEDGTFEFDSAFTVMRLAIAGSTTTTPPNPGPPSNPCCGHGPDSPGPILPPTGPGWTPLCVGAGAVSTAPDLFESENWSSESVLAGL